MDNDELKAGQSGTLKEPYWGYRHVEFVVCVHTSYTFRPAKKKFDKLIEQYKLVEVEDE